LAQGKQELVSQWLAQHETDPDGKPIFQLEVERIVYARILLTQGRLDEATELLQTICIDAETDGRTSRLIEMLNLQALVFQSDGDIDNAISALERALTVAESGGFVRIFVDEGPPMARLLYEAISREIAPDYARRLLAAFQPVEPVRSSPADAHTFETELIEPLSEREIEVLQLIAEGLTNQEIAARLFLSPHTVKVHARNVNGKLGVHNRTQAVTRARALGLLPPT